MSMATQSTQLLDLIAGRKRPAGGVKRAQVAAVAPAGLSALLCAALCKRAQYLGESSKNRQHAYAQSVANMRAQRQQAAAAAAARQNAARRGFTGDADYDNLADVRARRMRQNTAQMREEYYKSRKDLIQRKDQAAIKNEVGPVKSWGDNDTFRNGVRVAMKPLHVLGGAVGSVALGAMNLMEGRGFMEGQKNYWRDHMKDSDDVAHDAANNFQMFGNSAVQGATTIGRAANHYVRPSTWKSDAASRAAAWSRKNEWANADARYNEKMNQLQGKFRDTSLSDPNSTFGKVNRFAMEQTGKLLGETAALGAAGSAVGAAGRGIHAGTKAMAGAVRGAQAARTGSGLSNLGARAWQGTRNMAARGIEAAGDTVAMPFDAVGSLAHPIQTARSVGPGVARYANQTIAQPVRNLYGMIRHPMQTAQYVGAHPFRAAGNAVAAPVRWGWNAAKPFMSDTGFKATAAYGAMRNMYNGDSAGAAGEIGDMAAMGALGPAYMAYMVGRGVYGGMQPQEGY